MSGFWKKLLPKHQRRETASATVFVDLDAFAGPIYAIGDVHGCSQLLKELLADIAADAAVLNRTPLIILLGDLIDRGGDSAGVLDLVSAPRYQSHLTSVIGNHEQMMLAFLEDPHGASEWIELGGFETLRSYGLSLPLDQVKATPRRRLEQILSAHVPAEHIGWLRSLPHGYKARINDEIVLLTHAGYDASRSEVSQPVSTLLWGRGASNDLGSIRLVQGHVIVDDVDPFARRIKVDTGAWKTGVLSAVRLLDGTPIKVLSVRDRDRALSAGKGSGGTVHGNGAA